jgi:pimeloyl-ACP methyl ester carboxylesterase
MTNSPTTFWFFIRGLMRESAHWEGFPEAFESAFPGNKVVPLDLPGSGINWNLKCPLTVYEMAAILREQAKQRIEQETSEKGIRPDCYVLAISLGGMVALEWLQRFPEDFKGGVFINISLSGVNAFYQRLKPEAWLPLLKIVLTRDVKLRERKILELTTSKFQVKDSHLKDRVEVFEKHPATKTNFIRQLFAASRFRPIPKMVNPPILLLNSEGDRLVDFQCSVAIGEKWNWRVKTHPTANHDLPLEDPDWVITQIRDWKKQNEV